eukprot:TRINITY_DN2320_c0_g1_i1.p1 TRINITY_DN2320_c0_g1~~TRINITY_DN2320_c0_g1_i1.p1  ORF type:complete len:243 (-),score=89.43 TRINITY_DN2320_c0_g1_i1:37-765(-)
MEDCPHLASKPEPNQLIVSQEENQPLNLKTHRPNPTQSPLDRPLGNGPLRRRPTTQLQGRGIRKPALGAAQQPRPRAARMTPQASGLFRRPTPGQPLGNGRLPAPRVQTRTQPTNRIARRKPTTKPQQPKAKAQQQQPAKAQQPNKNQQAAQNQQPKAKAPQQPKAKAPQQPKAKAPQQPKAKAPQQPKAKAPQQPKAKNQQPNAKINKINQANKVSKSQQSQQSQQSQNQQSQQSTTQSQS